MANSSVIPVDILLIRYTSTLMVCYIINYHTPGLAGTVILTADGGNRVKPVQPEGKFKIIFCLKGCGLFTGELL